MSSLAYRQRLISERIRCYRPATFSTGGYGVRNMDTGKVVAGPYDIEGLAETQCRMLAAADIEAHYAELMLSVLAMMHGKRWDEATAALAKFVQQSGRDA